MSLVLKISSREDFDRKAFNFSEKTGAYSATTNVGGWGTPNPATAAGVNPTLIITKYKDTVSYTVSLPSTFPTSNTSLEYSVPYTLFGGTSSSDTIPDGVYNITYIIYDASNPTAILAQTDTNFAFAKGVECCIGKAISRLGVPRHGCGCEDDSCELAYNALLLDGICNLVKFDNLDQAEEVISYLQSYCDSNNCGCN